MNVVYVMEKVSLRDSVIVMETRTLITVEYVMQIFLMIAYRIVKEFGMEIFLLIIVEIVF